jgi:hypothetical protein
MSVWPAIVRPQSGPLTGLEIPRVQTPELASASNLNSTVDTGLLTSNCLVRYEVAAGTNFDEI